MTAQDYAEELIASRVEVDSERFDADSYVLSVNLELSIDGEEQVLSIQRGYGEEDSDGLCLVLSPSQQCAYDPFAQLVLERTSLGMMFTPVAAKVFDSASVRFSFTVSDDVFREMSGALATLCQGESFYHCNTSGA